MDTLAMTITTVIMNPHDEGCGHMTVTLSDGTEHVIHVDDVTGDQPGNEDPVTLQLRAIARALGVTDKDSFKSLMEGKEVEA